MPDVTLCLWREPVCPLASTCYLALAEPSEWRQSYFAPTLRGELCPYYTKEVPMDERCKPLKEK